MEGGEENNIMERGEDEKNKKMKGGEENKRM